MIVSRVLKLMAASDYACLLGSHADWLATLTSRANRT